MDGRPNGAPSWRLQEQTCVRHTPPVRVHWCMHATVMWPRYSLYLWCGTLAAGLLMAWLIPTMRPLLVNGAWVLFMIPLAALSGMMLRSAGPVESAELTWAAWKPRLTGIAALVIVVACWLQMVLAPSETLTMTSALTPLLNIALGGILLIAVAVGHIDQRHDDEQRLAEHLRRLQEPTRWVQSGVINDANVLQRQ